MRKDRGKDQDKVLTLRRSGSVIVGAKLYRSQCGYPGERLLTYDVTVSGREIGCPRGWLLDNNDIPRYFEQTYGEVREFKSCEAVASRAVDDFIALTALYKARPTYIRVAVSGIKDSEISCECLAPAWRLMADHEPATHRTERWVLDATDGYCPQCLVEEIARLRAEIARLRDERALRAGAA